MVEAGQALENQITQILNQNLGSERAAVLTNAASGWLTGFATQEPDVVTVMQHSNGTYYIYSQTGHNYFNSDGIPASAAYYQIPQNLAPFFTDLVPPPDNGP